MAFVGLDDMLGAVVANTLTDSIKMINISELHDSPDNFFEVNRVEELAEAVLAQGGVKENLIVRPLESGGYEVISGHRRKAAVQYLIDKGEDVSHKLPCLVQDFDDSDKMMNLIMMNVSQRVLSDAEMFESYKKLKEIFDEKKALGEKFGRMRDRIAEILNVSPAQIGKIENIKKNAVAEIVEAVEAGNMSLHTANEMAKLNEQEQRDIINSTDDIKNITPKKAKKKSKAKGNNKASRSDADPKNIIKEMLDAIVLKDKLSELLKKYEYMTEETEDGEDILKLIASLQAELLKLNEKVI
ncbi:MAG: ParB/RepB/Spo0J family partition protein [Ruminococcus sp.]|nr:ParB/RepB/Spo0J family partition protein [Ruminococcus sp.]